MGKFTVEEVKGRFYVVGTYLSVDDTPGTTSRAQADDLAAAMNSSDPLLAQAGIDVYNKQQSESGLNTSMKFADLPEDMQELLRSFAEERGFDFCEGIGESVLPIVAVDVATFVQQVLNEPWDYRGKRHVAALARCYAKGETLPPIVIEDGVWRDGRHRLLAAEKALLKVLPAIDLASWIRISLKSDLMCHCIVASLDQKFEPALPAKKADLYNQLQDDRL